MVSGMYPIPYIAVRGVCIKAVRQSACLVVTPVTFNSFAVLFNCMPVDRGSDYDSPSIKLTFWLFGAGLLSVS